MLIDIIMFDPFKNPKKWALMSPLYPGAKRGSIGAITCPGHPLRAGALTAELLSFIAAMCHRLARKPAFWQNLGRRQKLYNTNLKFSSTFTESRGENPARVHCFPTRQALPQFIQSRLVLGFSETDSVSQPLGALWAMFLPPCAFISLYFGDQLMLKFYISIYWNFIYARMHIKCTL